jgi:divalent metal cation (Fe/Co/Zn/Cd) transporter
MTGNPATILAQLKVRGDLTPEEEATVKAAIEEAMSKVDDALRVVLVMIEEIDRRKQEQKDRENAH